MKNPEESQDDAPTYEKIYEPVKLTAYDRRRQELRDLEVRLNDLRAVADPTELQRKQIVAVAAKAERAAERLDKEVERSRDDVWRKRRNIDDWRAGEGKEAYRAGRRKVRDKPNTPREVLAAMTQQEREQHDKDRRADANWFKVRRDKGMPEDEIEAAYALRLENRQRDRGTGYESDPLYGAF